MNNLVCLKNKKPAVLFELQASVFFDIVFSGQTAITCGDPLRGRLRLNACEALACLLFFIPALFARARRPATLRNKKYAGGGAGI
jgi:hypothetical protein